MRSDLLACIWGHPENWPKFSSRDWELLIGQSRQASLLARLASHCSDRAWMEQVPEGPRRHLEGGLRLADRQQHEVRWELNRIAAALRTLNAPVILLKGAAYVAAGLPPARGRLFSDIDIMVPRDQIGAAEAALLGAGWISDERDPYNQRYYRQWMHEVPPLRHIQRNTFIDLHHTITPPTSRFNVNGDELIARAGKVDGLAGLHVLSPTDMVLHSAVHLFQEGEFGHGLRDLLDLNDLLQFFPSRSDSFWVELLDRAEELKLQIPLFHALFHVRRLFATSAPAHLQARVLAFGPNPLARAMMAWMLELALRPQHPSCDSRWTGLARWCLYVRAHVLRMPPYLVIPHLLRKAWMRRFPDDDARKSTG